MRREKKKEEQQLRCSAPFKAGRAPSTSQNICYGHEERKVTGYTQGVLNTSCLLGIVTFLAKQQQRRECWYYIAWPPPFACSRSPNERWWWATIRAGAGGGSGGGGGGGDGALESDGGGGYRSFHHQIRLPSIRFFRSSYR